MRVDLVEVSHKLPEAFDGGQEAAIDEHGEGAMIDAQHTAITLPAREDVERGGAVVANLVQAIVAIHLVAFEEKERTTDALVAQLPFGHARVQLGEDGVQVFGERRNVVHAVGRRLGIQQKLKQIATSERGRLAAA